jgi:putative ABC transport system permease protein
VTEKQGVRDYVIDHQYLNHFKLPLVAGENFPENLQQQNELFVLVNETFCRDYGLGDATEAVGKSLTLGDSTPVVVRGVVKDFFFRPSTYGMEPLLLRYSPAHLSVLNLEIRTTDVTQTMAALERTWKSIAPESTFDAEFYDAAVRRNYEGYMSTVRLVGFLGALGLIIACLGLLGMTIYTVETRAREVSIRKVMGAGFSDVIMMLSKGYILVLMIAMIIAIPVSFLLGTQLVQEFAQRASWSAWVFIPGILLMFIFAGAIISSQTIRAALADPVKTLRAE